MLGLALTRLSLAQTFTLSATYCTGSTPCVTTYHNDNNRDGVNPHESTFTPSYVGSHTFSATTVATDGLIYAQPLYIHGLSVSGSCSGSTNVVFVATENDTVYAVNAANGTVCWQHHFITGSFPEKPIPYTDLPTNGTGGDPCYNLLPQVGITSTPVIDTSVTPPVLYVVSNHEITTGAGATFSQRLHALDATNGSEFAFVDLGPALGSSFDVLVEMQRAGLALSKPSSNLANIYVTWASNCDFAVTGHPYDGWAAAFQVNYSSPTSGFSLLGSFVTAPTGVHHQSGIWMAGGAPAIDSSGNVYVAVANGDFDNSTEWGDSILKLSASLGSSPHAERLHAVTEWQRKRDSLLWNRTTLPFG